MQNEVMAGQTFIEALPKWHPLLRRTQTRGRAEQGAERE